MDDHRPRYWFPAKRHGWGWGMPATWQGWLVLITWLAIMIGVGPWLASRNVTWFGWFTAGMLAAIIAICWLTGEPPRWRWGGDD